MCQHNDHQRLTIKLRWILFIGLRNSTGNCLQHDVINNYAETKVQWYCVCQDVLISCCLLDGQCTTDHPLILGTDWPLRLYAISRVSRPGPCDSDMTRMAQSMVPNRLPHTALATVNSCFALIQAREFYAWAAHTHVWWQSGEFINRM